MFTAYYVPITILLYQHLFKVKSSLLFIYHVFCVTLDFSIDKVYYYTIYKST